MLWIPNLNALPLIVGGVFCVILSTVVWKSRQKPIAHIFLYMTIFVAAWAFGEFGQQGVQTSNGRIIWTTINLTAIPFVAPLYLLFSFSYTQQNQRVMRPLAFTLFSIATLTVLTIWTNEIHHLFYRSITLDQFVRGPIFYIHAIYTYLLIIGAIAVFALFYIQAAQVRKQTAILLAGAVLPLTVNLLFLSRRFTAHASIDWTPFIFVVSIGIIAWGLYQGGILNISNIAQQVIVDNMPNAVFVLNQESILLQMNSQARQIAQTIEYPILEVGHSASSLLENLRQSADANSYEIKLTSDSETTSIFEANVTPLMDQRAQINGQVIILRDITAQKQALVGIKMQKEMADQAIQVAREASEFKTRLIARISHEFRTPLGAMLGIAGMLDTGALGELNEQQHQMNSRILQNARRLTKLVDELLDQSKLDDASLNLHETTLNPNLYIKSLIEQFESLGSQKDLYLCTNLATDTTNQIICDPRSIYPDCDQFDRQCAQVYRNRGCHDPLWYRPKPVVLTH